MKSVRGKRWRLNGDGDGLELISLLLVVVFVEKRKELIWVTYASPNRPVSLRCLHSGTVAGRELFNSSDSLTILSRPEGI